MKGQLQSTGQRNYTGPWQHSLKTKALQFDNIVVTSGTVSCHNDIVLCHQWRQSRQINYLFSVLCQYGVFTRNGMQLMHLTVWHYIALELHCVLAAGKLSLRRHQMEKFSALLALCDGNPTVTGGFPSQMTVTRGFDVFLDLCLGNRSLLKLSQQTLHQRKQSRRRWFETPSRSLWRHCNVW